MLGESDNTLLLPEWASSKSNFQLSCIDVSLFLSVQLDSDTSEERTLGRWEGMYSKMIVIQSRKFGNHVFRRLCRVPASLEERGSHIGCLERLSQPEVT